MELDVDNELRMALREILAKQAEKAMAEPDEMKARAIMVMSGMDIIAGGASLIGAVMKSWGKDEQQEMRDLVIEAMDEGLRWGKETS